MREIVLASRNPKKLKELRALLAPADYELRAVNEFSAVEPEETAGTFVENALIKARHAASVSGLPALADDSGLEVAALGGAPGVRSARYAGFEVASFASTARLAAEQPAMDGRAGGGRVNRGRAMDGMSQVERDDANNAKLLDALREAPDAQRAARFVAVLVLLRHADDPVPLIAQGFWQGSILRAPSGTNGFGYDPLFLDPASGLSAAELSAEEKAARSHRARAMAALLAQLREPPQ